MTYVYAAGAAFVLALLLTEAMRRLALAIGFVDRPAARKAHLRPTPYLGGAAVVLALLAALFPLFLADRPTGGGAGGPLLALTGGALAVCVLGLVDDLRPLGYTSRLVVEAAAAGAVVLAGGSVPLFGNLLDPVLTVLWIVLVTNGFNLLDNMDGASPVVATVTAAFLAWTAHHHGQGGLALLLGALAATCAGFLAHNWHPARIFLGDMGSLFIGFLLSGAAVLLYAPGGGTDTASAHPAALLLVTLVTTTDTALVLIARHRAGRPLLQGGKDHIAHRMQRIGVGVRRTALSLAAFAAAGCTAAVLLELGALHPHVALAAALLAAVCIIVRLLPVPVYDVPAPLGGARASEGKLP